MNYLSASAIRTQFLNYFKSKQHHIVPSAPIVIKNDPTLMFTNAGMNQFKDYFLGNQKAPFSRIADTQKCLRVSGKHNDLEEVGVDTYHHTMFEMLGNWSFGDYFKPEAIAWSWEFLTDVLKIEKDRLYVTIFEGDANENLPKDEEAFNEWKKHIAEDRILLGNKKDNFWEMGDTGPCGPCTEIHIDCRTDDERNLVDGATLVNADHPQVIEIWNNVFIQFNRKKDSSLEELPAKHVDTGMGFERLVRVIQNKSSNYDTDVFSPIIDKVATITQYQYDGSDTKQAIAFRVIADHIRAVCFTIADGQLPSNTGAGYVIRRILRRAVRYYFSYLNRKEPLLHLLVDTLAEQFKDVFSELHQQQSFVQKVILEEETTFLKTLDNGLKKMEIITQNKNNTIIDGKTAFELYDTYGFPLDLTQLIALENNFRVDEKGFEVELQAQKERSRAATKIEVDDWTIVNEGTVEFVGYDVLQTTARILKYRKVDAKGNEQYQIVLDKTPFYAESGGQIGDRGILSFSNEIIEVNDTKKENDLIIHYTDELPKNLNETLEAHVYENIRHLTANHHTATHLLHAALRTVLGEHVAQKGSLVNNDYLRFDFSHFAKCTDEELLAIEKLVNEKIRANIPVVIKEMDKDEAIKLGAMALFGEKYGNDVRVVIIDEAYSIELCGGTHVANTGELGLFKITSESGIAAGVRRIEAVCASKAEHFINEKLDELQHIYATLKNTKDAVHSIQQLQEENQILKKQIEQQALAQVGQLKEELKQKIINKNGVNILITTIDNISSDALKKLQFDLKHEVENLFFLATTVNNNKPMLSLIIADNVVKEKNLHAGNIIKQLAKNIKGGGGGQAFYATAGGNDVSGIDKVIEEAKQLI